MLLACPICRSTIHPNSFTCERGHSFEQRDGVLSLLTPQFAAQLNAFAQAFAADRITQHYPALPHSAYAHLPFGDAVRNDPEWRSRQADLRAILTLLPKDKPLRILDVGAWNGWLSHQLAKHGHVVTAVSYFADAQDGLGARTFYPNPQWRAIQMDECELDLIQEQFDVVVLNRCVHFSPDTARQVQAAQARVAQGGLLFVTGLNIFKDPSQCIARIQQRMNAFEQRHGISLFLRPTRGYLDWGDVAHFQKMGLHVKPIWSLWGALLKSIVWPTSPRPCYGVWRR
jgi:2-polyprenyl-3-methyl-5-hydroxy-6-metoxy-1,4-benzoquinol methylase